MLLPRCFLLTTSPSIWILSVSDTKNFDLDHATKPTILSSMHATATPYPSILTKLVNLSSNFY